MAKETKDERLQKWQDRIRAGIKYREEKTFHTRWNTWSRWLRATFDQGTMPHNLITAFYKAFVPKIYFRQPRVIVKPERPDLYWQALIREKVLNQVLEEIKLKHQIKLAIGDAFWFTLGDLKTGFDSEFGFFPSQADLDAGDWDKETWKDAKGNLLEYNSSVKPGMPWALRVKPKNLVVPWGSESAESLVWIADKITRHIDDVKADPKYSNIGDLEPNLKANPSATGISKEYQEEYVEYYEIRDIRSGMMLDVCLDHDKFMLEEKDRLQVEGLPHSFLNFNEDLDQFWGVPDSKYLEAKQRELNEIDTQLMKHRRIAIAKFLYQMEAIDEDEVVKLTSERVAAGIKVKGRKPVQEAFMELKTGIPQELVELKRMTREDMRELFGFSRIELGEFQGKTHVTKEEVMRVGKGSEIRLSERGDMVADLVKDVVRKISCIIFGGVWKAPRFVEIIGPDLMRYWVEFTGEALAGEYTYDIEPVEETPMSPEDREDRAFKRLQVLLPLAMPQVDPNTGQMIAPPLIDRVELVRQYIYAAGANAERLFQQAPKKMGMNEFMQQAPQMEEQFRQQFGRGRQ